MASVFNSLNVGSGLDVRSLVTGLVEAERAPRAEALTAREARVAARISAQGQFRTAIDALVTALGTRVASGSLSGIPAVSDPSILTMRVDPGTLVARQTLEVRALAQGQTLSSGTGVDPEAPVGLGTLTFRFGTVAGTTAATGFTPGRIADLTVTVTPGDDSLEGLRRAINDAAAVAGAPVQAQIVRDADGSRLLLRGSMGQESGFIIETSGDPSLGRFAFSNTGPSNLSRTQVAQDARVAVDGVELRRPANAIDDLVPGARLALGRAAPGTLVTVSAARDTAELAQVVRDVAGALDELSAIGRELSSSGTATGSAGALVSDSSARRALGNLARLTTEAILPENGAAPRRLSDIGISLTREGNFTVNEARLAAAVRDHPAAIEAMITAVNRPASFGQPAGALRAIGDQFRVATTPAAGQPTALQREQADIARQRGLLETRMARLTETYTRQFAALDRNVGQSRALQDFLTQQIDIWTRAGDR